MSGTYKLAAAWAPDCQGKQDYDGPVLEISSRFWPRGGSHDVFSKSADGATLVSDRHSPSRHGIPPSGHSALILRHGEDDYVTVAEREFEAETEEEVKRQVEEWAQAQMDRVASFFLGADTRHVR